MTAVRLLPSLFVALTGLACSADNPTAIVASGGGDGQDSNAVTDGDGGSSSQMPQRDPQGTSDAGVQDGRDAEICETLFVAAEPKLPKILIVLDRSESMVKEAGVFGSTQTHRWEQAVPAVKAVTAELDDVVQFGLMVFPGTPPKPYGKDFCESGHVDVEIGVGTATQIASVLDATVPKGATPLAKSLDAAHEALIADRNDPDAVQRDGYVLLITDGQPVCKNDSNTTPDPESSYAAVDRLREDDIKTYVIGFDTGGLDVLDELAKRGGTGETTHRNVTDQAGLVADLEEISRSLVSCKYALEAAPADPAYVRVQIDGKSYPFNDQGWQLVDDKTIELRGPACTVLQDSQEHDIKISVECEPVIVK